MRTPIACIQCRRSKIKCSHSGQPPCRHCANTNKPCEIPQIMPDYSPPVEVRHRSPAQQGNPSDLESISSEQEGIPRPPMFFNAAGPLKRSQTTGEIHLAKRSKYNESGLPPYEVIAEACSIFFQHFYNDVIQRNYKRLFIG